MPLKHFTETFLVFLLGVILALTGVFTATVPPFPQGVMPMGILFLATVLYPLLWTPLLTKRRADNAFRIMQWMPMFLVIAAALFHLLAMRDSEFDPLLSMFLYGWTLSAVALGFALLAAFCLHVVRRRGRRIALLLLIFVPFVTAAMAGAQEGRRWERELAAVLWRGQWWDLTTEGRLLADMRQEGDDDAYDEGLAASEDPNEEAWRERLRAQRRREERIAERLAEQREETGSIAALLPPKEVAESSAEAVAGSFSSKPARLPSSGMDVSFLLTLMLAGYAGTVHRRMVRG